MRRRWWDRTESDVADRLENLAADYEAITIEVRRKVQDLASQPPTADKK